MNAIRQPAVAGQFYPGNAGQLSAAVSGYLGLVLAVGVVQAIPSNEYLRDPSVELPAALVATVVLVFTGALAGWFPARRAARVPATEALRA